MVIALKIRLLKKKFNVLVVENLSVRWLSKYEPKQRQQ
jgi:hypothetical protein